MLAVSQSEGENATYVGRQTHAVKKTMSQLVGKTRLEQANDNQSVSQPFLLVTQSVSELSQVMGG